MPRWVLIALGSFAAAALYWSPALWELDRTGFGDWQQFQHQWEASYVSVARYGEAPMWNPWHCGGVILFGDPQLQAYSPLFWLVFPFGTTVGLKLFLLIHAALGFAGAYVFAQRRIGLGRYPAMLASLVWAGSGFFAWHGSGGHSAFLPFYFVPWLLLAWEAASRDLRYVAAVVGIMGLTVLEGGVYPFPYFCLLLAFDGLWRIAEGKAQAKSVVRAGVLTVPLMVLVAGFRLVPILNTMSRYPRPTAGDDALSFAEVWQMLTSREYDYAFPGHEYVWAEYGTFIGVIAVALGLVGLWRCARGDRDRRLLVIGTVLFGLLMMGRGSAVHPWPLLHALPVYGSLRVPSRFAVLMTFYFGMAAGVGLQWALGWLRARRWPADLFALRRAAPALIVLAVALHIAWGNGEVIARWEGPPLPSIDPSSRYVVTPFSEYGGYASFPARGVSTRGCYTGMTYPAAVGLRVGDVAQAWFVGEGREDASVRWRARTANTMALDVAVPEAAPTLEINQTWALGWRSDVGEVVRARNGLLHVTNLPAGEHTVRLRYRPDDLGVAIALGLAGVGGTLSLLLVLTIRRRRARR